MGAPEKYNAPGHRGVVGKVDYTRDNPSSTATEEQRRRIIAMLRTGPRSTLDFRRVGIMQSQTRVHELRRKGYDLPTVARLTIADDEGYLHNGVALYELLGEPDLAALAMGDAP